MNLPYSIFFLFLLNANQRSLTEVPMWSGLSSIRSSHHLLYRLCPFINPPLSYHGVTLPLIFSCNPLKGKKRHKNITTALHEGKNLRKIKIFKLACNNSCLCSKHQFLLKTELFSESIFLEPKTIQSRVI